MTVMFDEFNMLDAWMGHNMAELLDKFVFTLWQ